jgi:hypothetical protein
MVLISSTGYSCTVLLPQPISGISLSSRQREAGEAVNVYYYLTCVVLRVCQDYTGIIESVVMSRA